MADERDLFCGVNTPLDPDNLIDLEKKHTPVISAPATAQTGQPLSVTVEVGKLLAHPNELGHHIEWLDLYEDKLYLARIDFSGGRVSPKATLELMLKKDGLLRAFASCNLHGIWEGCTEIKVS